MTGQPSPGELWGRAYRDHIALGPPGQAERYHDLMIEHGYRVPPCDWTPGRPREEPT
jgi:hypothetical protein